MIPRRQQGRTRLVGPFHPSRVLLVASLALSFTGPVTALQGEIELQINDSHGNAVSGARLTLSAAGEVVASGTTNKKGKFRSRVDPGAYQLRCEAEGLAPAEREIKVEEGMVLEMTLQLLDPERHRKSLAIEAFNAGVAAIQGGDSSAALPKFIEAADFDPELAEAQRMVAALHLEAGDADAAAPALEAYLALKPLDGAVAAIAYQIYRHTGNEAGRTRAAEALKAAGEVTDTAIRVFNEGVKATRNGDDAGAIAAFEEVVSLDPAFAAARQSLAAFAFNDQRYKDAIVHLHALLESQPEHKEGLRMAFFALAFEDQKERAAGVGKTWARVVPGALDEIVAEADRLFGNDELASARSMTEILLAVAPDYPRGHYTMGRIFAASGQAGEAKRHLSQFVELSPDDPEAAAAREMLAGL